MTEPENPELEDPEPKPRMTLEEAQRYRDEHAMDLAHLADKVSMSSKRRAEMEARAEMEENQSPEDPD
jgi:hypothetical protein